MPVCLPPPNFKDTEIEAKAVGVGRSAEQNTCLTDSNGPEVFTKCAKKWVGPKESDQWVIRKNKYLWNMHITQCYQLSVIIIYLLPKKNYWKCSFREKDPFTNTFKKTHTAWSGQYFSSNLKNDLLTTITENMSCHEKIV